MGSLVLSILVVSIAKLFRMPRLDEVWNSEGTKIVWNRVLGKPGQICYEILFCVKLRSTVEQVTDVRIRTVLVATQSIGLFYSWATWCLGCGSSNGSWWRILKVTLASYTWTHVELRQFLLKVSYFLGLDILERCRHSQSSIMLLLSL